MINRPPLPLGFRRRPLRLNHSLEQHERLLPRGGNGENQLLFQVIDSMFFLGAIQKELVSTDISAHDNVLLTR